MDDVLDLERRVERLTAEREALAAEVRRLRAANERVRTEAARTHSDITDGSRPAWQLAHRILRTLDGEA